MVEVCDELFLVQQTIILVAMETEPVKNYFQSENVIEHYARAATQVGLWRSEEKIFTRLFKKDDSLLELGAGVGRIAIGLHELGYRNVLATDYARPMVRRARDLCKVLEYSIPFHVADARSLVFEDSLFEGAIFGFNGLMQIPRAGDREAAMAEIFRVLRPGAWFAFTTHDRERSPHQEFWQAERDRWAQGQQDSDYERFGDRAEPAEGGIHFMHVPSVAEVETLIDGAGFRLEATIMRSELAQEPPEVEAFSDDCRFWVVQRP